MKRKLLPWCMATCLTFTVQAQQLPPSGATESTPSHSEYFSWISHTNEGPTTEHTLANLAFFQWLKDTYGMQLDIYAFDAGAIDGKNFYGSMKSDRFKYQFPQGFKPISDAAGKMGTNLGIWGGPDGFGNTPEEARERIDMMVGLTRDHNLRLFKVDGVCGELRPDKYDYFIEMMSKIRQIAPDFVLLNHRLNLGPGVKYATTFLLGGEETYIDVFMTNDMTAPHHRAKAISRKLPENLTRLTEDHGVCLSSCLDYWEDDLLLQAFNRNLIVSPQIYGNPWLLRDDEFPYLAYIFNLHRDYRDILPSATRLPEANYGPQALARGDGKTQLLTLRNLTWNPVKYKVQLGEETGLTDNKKKVKARLYHPYIMDLGSHTYGSTIEVEVLPFRAALVKLTTEPEKDAIALSGIPYQIINDRVGNAYEVKLLGKAGHTYDVRLESDKHAFKSAKIDETLKNGLLSGRSVKVRFDGQKMLTDYHRKIADMQECPVPDDVSSIYFATCFAADNNAMELRSLKRSGETKIPAVQAARDAFFNQKVFKQREISDRALFDDDLSTAFSISFRRSGSDRRPGNASSFYLDMGESIELDKMVIDSYDEHSIEPMNYAEGAYILVSNDLKDWQVMVVPAEKHMEIDLSKCGKIRYFRLGEDWCPIRLAEVTGYKDGKKVNRDKWRANNLFRNYADEFTANRTWKTEFTLDEVYPGAYLCVAINGEHGEEGAWAGFKIDGEYVGCPDRASSFISNTWEARTKKRDRNYTYYLPLTADMVGKRIEAYAIELNKKAGNRDLKPELWITAYPIPFDSKVLKLQK